ncbi:MAG TPA: aldo/keto reductase [Phycisphaerae bacterium]|jgi:aryl-alcohol dehydrogenase-like predicted oxidoreductase
MEYRQLGSTDMKVSILSYGASPLGSVFREIDEEQGIKTVHTAIDLGINFIDVSPFYGLTKAETVLGKALKGVHRSQYFLATKVGRYGHEMKDFDFSKARVTASVDESLARLGVETVDIIQCHDIEFGNVTRVIEETLPALRAIVKAGKARYIGVTGLPLKVFKQVLGATRVDAILSYCRYSLNDSGLEALLPMLETKRVGIINASPLSMGLLSDRGPASWHPAPAEIRETCAKAAAFCKSRGVDIASLAVQYAVGNKRIATTLVGTASVENITKNVQWAAEPYDPSLLAEVRKILAPIHNKTWPSGRPENN